MHKNQYVVRKGNQWAVKGEHNLKATSRLTRPQLINASYDSSSLSWINNEIGLIKYRHVTVLGSSRLRMKQLELLEILRKINTQK